MNIVFDIDDTLYNLMEPFEKAHEELFAGQTDADCESLFMASRIYSDEAFYMHEKGMLSAEEEFAYRIRKTYADVGIHVSQEQVTLFEQRTLDRVLHIHVPKAIQNILENCRENDVPIAALTNGKHVNQGKKIGVLQLTRCLKKTGSLFQKISDIQNRIKEHFSLCRKHCSWIRRRHGLSEIPLKWM